MDRAPDVDDLLELMTTHQLTAVNNYMKESWTRCAVAPLQWLIYSHLISTHLARKTGLEETKRLLTILADDYHCAGMFKTEYQFTVETCLSPASTQGMIANPSKSQAILKFRGSRAESLRRMYLVKTPNSTMLHIRRHSTFRHPGGGEE